MNTGHGGHGQTRRLVLFGMKGVVSRCRDFTEQALADWGWTVNGPGEDNDVVEDVLLLVSELVTNACLHAGGPRELVLALDRPQGRLRVEVADADPREPTPRAQSDISQPGGHGLIILERLAHTWGSEPRGTGKVVWLEIRLSPGPGRRAGRP
ncbi:ATP-binding protein [Streptomyces sp. NPDC003023]|uniref:ATP-binding protein n=1 Tax=Streptomyces sp. NPDC003023 TaxID=3364675 RepID=UPI0036CA4155